MFVFVPNPHIRLDRSWVAPYVPLELLMGVASAEAAGAPCAVYDLNTQVQTRCLRVSAEIWQQAAGRILELEPTAVFFETWTDTLHNTIQLCEAVATLDPAVPRVLFGAGSSAIARELFDAFESITGVIRGEIEPALIALAHGQPFVLHDAPGLCRRHSRGLEIPKAAWVPNLDELPHAAYHHALLSAGDSIPLESGRGCGQGCNFCALAGHWPELYRYRDPYRLALKMRALAERYPGSVLDLTSDPVFFTDRSRVEALCAALGQDVVQFCCHARVDAFRPRDLARLAAAGCRSLLFGIESGSPRLQRHIGKQLDLTMVMPTVGAALDAGVEVQATFIVGHPQETEEDLSQTRELALALNAMGAVVDVHLLRAYPGSPLHAGSPSYRFCRPIATAAECDTVGRALIERYPALFPASYQVETSAKTSMTFGTWVALSSFAEPLRAISAVVPLPPRALALPAIPETLEQGVSQLAAGLMAAVPADAHLDRQTLHDAIQLHRALFLLSRAEPATAFDLTASIHRFERDPQTASLAVVAPFQLFPIATDIDRLTDARISLLPSPHENAWGLLAKVVETGGPAHYTRQATLVESFALDDFGAEAFRRFCPEASLETIAQAVGVAQQVPLLQALEECIELARVLVEAGVLCCVEETVSQDSRG